jgi:flagellar hook-associated protein 1 FlgK
MADLLNIGISGLASHQTALNVTGQNIANVDTEGYSRQNAVITSSTPQLLDGHWLGNGATIDQIRRLSDEFLVSQYRVNTASFESSQALYNQASQIDNLLADQNTGLNGGLESFFAGLQTAADDPSSIPARQAFLSQASTLKDRFNALSSRLIAQNNTINGQLEVLTGQVNSLTQGIAGLNEQIQVAFGGGNGATPNDLLDQRDRMLQSLSGIIGTQVINQGDGSIGVLTGNGQALVVGTMANELKTVEGQGDSTRHDIAFVSGSSTQIISKQISGGEISGVLAFRDNVLDPALNQIGRIGLVIADTFNKQQHLGIDIDGREGKNLFTDINTREATLDRVLPSHENGAPQDRVVVANIADAGLLTGDEYKISFTGPGNNLYQVTRLSDNEVLATASLSGSFPDTVEFDGVEIVFEHGSFQQGDQFHIQPTRNAGRDIDIAIKRPDELAFAYPIATQTGSGNQGSGEIDITEVTSLNTQLLSTPGELSPPLLIRFISSTSYEILNNTDPAHPVPLVPALTNLPYVPGVSNNVLPEDLGQTVVTSYGGALPSQLFLQNPSPATQSTPGNGFFPERVTFNATDPQTGVVTQEPELFIPANTSSRETARLLSSRNGVEATATTMVEVSQFSQDAAPFLDTQFYLNGTDLTATLGPVQSLYEQDYPAAVPDPINANFIADRINSNLDFQNKGITATSDGETVKITSKYGDDIALEMKGDAGDSVMVSNSKHVKLNSLAITGASLAETSGYDFSQGGPYDYAFDVPGKGSFTISLTGNHTTGADVVSEIESKINQSGFYGNGNVEVSINAQGEISFQNLTQLTGAGLNNSHKMTMGGEVNIVMDENISMNTSPSGSNVFDEHPIGLAAYFGFQASISGELVRGDSFRLDFNTNAVSDNRNALKMVGLETRDTVNGKSSFTNAYAKLVENTGSSTNRANINREANQALMRQAQDARDSLSGVNLDEEAAKLIQYELGYNASAQVISIARQIFDTLISTFR